jgi:hypothetical protein
LRKSKHKHNSKHRNRQHKILNKHLSDAI